MSGGRGWAELSEYVGVATTPMNPSQLLRLTAALFTCFCATAPARAQSVEDFYRGKDIKLLIGADVGGTYGLYAQLMVRHMKQYIPGQPNVILQMMPGAGGNIALNYSHAIAPKDGTLMHLVHAEVLFETLLTSGVKFNARDYQYIGRIADADAVTITTKASGVSTLDDARKREVTLGATGVTNIFALAPLMLNRLAGTKFRIIGGYKGTADIHTAMERGEIDGAGVTLANIAVLHGDKLKSGELTPVFAIADKRIPTFPETPATSEFGAGAERTLLDIYASTATIGRALALPPGAPADRVRALREAFQKTLADPAFLTEIKRGSVPVAPMSGEDMGRYVETIMATPAMRLEAARTLHVELIRSAR